MRWHRRDVFVTASSIAWLVLAATGAVAVAVDITLALRRPDNRLRTALLGSLAGTCFQISTLSFNYKPVLWILFALVGAWTNCIRHHQPDFTVKLTWKDLLFIIGGCLAFVIALLPVFLKFKGVM